MSNESRWVLPMVALTGMALLAVAGLTLFTFNKVPDEAPRDTGREPAKPERAEAGPKSFQDRAQESGITFRMSFLPNEQGEKFKINLYDHGCGVAVGDFDGDGRDDLYFCNQLGRDALYRNKGDGTFADVTDRAG